MGYHSRENYFGIDGLFYTYEFFRALFNVPPIEEVKDCKRVFRAFFMPSFHPEVCIIVKEVDDICRISLATFQTNIESFQMYLWMSDDGKWPSQAPVPAKPNLFKAMHTISEAKMKMFKSKMDSFLPRVHFEKHGGMDGISAWWDYIDELGESFSYYDWIYDQGDPEAYHFCCAMYQLAAEIFTDEISTPLLENIYGYLKLGLPIKNLGGTPYTIRIFGKLSLAYQERIALFLNQLSITDPLLMDLSHFEGMGTLLYPTFQAFIEQRQDVPTCWWASPYARKHLLEIGVPSSQIFDSKEAALKILEDFSSTNEK